MDPHPMGRAGCNLVSAGCLIWLLRPVVLLVLGS